jgi:hypothetical protein
MRSTRIGVLALAALTVSGVLLARFGADEGVRAETDSNSEVFATAAPPPVLAAPAQSPASPTDGSSPSAHAWITALCANVRAAPGMKSKILGHVFQGDPVEVVSRQNDGSSSWYKIRDGAGYLEGWVSARLISSDKVESGFVIPESYKEPRTPSVDTKVTSKFVGAAACRDCHEHAHDAQFSKWRSHFHSDAFKTLGKPYAVAFAKKRGVENPTTDWRCVKCHVTAYGVPAERKGPGYHDEEGVTCEACHGPGGGYLEAHARPKPDRAALQAAGFRVFRDLKQRDEFCRTCHNELSPSYKPFNVEQFSLAIQHWAGKIEIAYADQLDKQAGGEEKKHQNAKPFERAAVAVEVPLPSPSPRPSPSPTLPASPSPIPTSTPSPTPSEAPSQTVPSSSGPADKPVPSPMTTREAGPREVQLNVWSGAKRGAVRFTHALHAKYVDKGTAETNCLVCHHTNKASDDMDSCGSCHKQESSGKTPNREQAFHNSCRDCHRQLDEGPRKCVECHGSS